MTAAVFATVLFAALLHATWNAIVKGAGDKLLTTVLVTAFAATLAAAALPFLPSPAAASWPFIAISAVLQVLYFLLMARTYQSADMSQAYPLMRGTAPLMVAAISALWADERLPAMAWAGVGVICAGILGMALEGRDGGRHGMSLALLNAVVIAAYTLVDGLGVRRSGAPSAYTAWIFLLTGLGLVGWALSARRTAFVAHLARHWRRGLAGGAGTLVSYGLALWAMTLAPVAVVAALRETSILFGTLIAWLVLRERIGALRLAAACAIALGAALLRLA